jgi:hypothetical protein
MNLANQPKPQMREVRLRRLNVGIVEGLHCAFCGVRLRPFDIEETETGFRVICSGDNGCHQVNLTCEPA